MFYLFTDHVEAALFAKDKKAVLALAYEEWPSVILRIEDDVPPRDVTEDMAWAWFHERFEPHTSIPPLFERWLEDAAHEANEAYDDPRGEYAKADAEIHERMNG